jgi:catechol 2,3-dioxygenase-like lactoylglutathione lyase family enzyme
MRGDYAGQATTQEDPVLERFYVNPVLPAQNGDRARAFYRDVLGLELVSGPQDDPMMFRAGGGTSIVITELPDRVPREAGGPCPLGELLGGCDDRPAHAARRGPDDRLAEDPPRLEELLEAQSGHVEVSEAVFTEQPGPACVDRSTSQTRSHHRALFSAAASTRSSIR